MFKSIVLLVSTIVTVCAAELVHPKLSAAVKNTPVSGVEGLNLHLTVPYKYQDYLLGFKYTVSSDIKKLPDSFFANKNFETPLDGSANVNAEFSVDDKTLHLDTEWSSAKHGVTAAVKADSKDYLKKVKVSKTQTLPNGFKGTMKVGYNVVKNVFCADASVTNGATTVGVCGDSDSQDPVVSITHNVDENNEVAPSVSLRTGAMSYGFTRRWLGGSAKANLVLNDKVSVEWKDNGASGAWTTTADVPLNGDKPRISFSRDWVY